MVLTFFALWLLLIKVGTEFNQNVLDKIQLTRSFLDERFVYPENEELVQLIKKFIQ